MIGINRKDIKQAGTWPGGRCDICECECVNVIYLLSTILKHYKAACTINELDSKAALLHLQLPTNTKGNG